MPAPITLRVLLLGTPAILVNDQAFQIQRRLLRWILFFLACQKEMVGRSELMLLFWPEESEEDARRHLREALSKLRAQLPDPNLILTEQDRVGLDPLRSGSDVQEFQGLFAQIFRACAQTPPSTPLTPSVHQSVERAVRLWRNGRFLSGAQLPESEALSDWLLQTSQQLESQRQRLLERLVDHDTASGDIESAIHWLRSALEGDETNDTLQYRLLNLLHKQGRYSEALNHCSYLQELFRREGYAELPPALLSLYKMVREEANQPSAARERPTWPSLADMQVPFAGRETLLQALQFAARRGSPAIVFGEAGSGKSRLLRELFFSLKPAHRLLLAPAHILENTLPYQPIIDMLRHDIRAEEWKQMNLVWATPLALLLPELTIMRPEIRPPQIAPDQQNSLLFEALRQLLLFLGAKQRFLLFLDNAQWCDASTLAALAYLAERGLFGESGALVLAARTEEQNLHLESFLNRPRSDFSVQRLALTPLNSREIGVLAHYVLGDAYSNTILPRLERETGGNPLFLLETLRLIQDYSMDARISANLDHLPLASSIHALIRDRLEHLTPYDAQILSLAAIIGSDFSIDLLEQTSQMPPEQVVQSLESLAQSNLIQAIPHDRPSSGYAFVQEKYREVILLDLSAARRRLLHLRVARILEQKQLGQSPDIEANLASHYEEAGELEAAFKHWLKAALYAGRIYDKEQAFTAYRRAEQIQQRLGEHIPDSAIYQLYKAWAGLSAAFGDAATVEQASRVMLQLGQNRHSPLLVGSAYNGLAQSAELRMQPVEGKIWLEKGQAFLAQSGDMCEQIEALNRQGLFQMLQGQYADARRAYEQALELDPCEPSIENLCQGRAISQYRQSVLLLLSGWPAQAQTMAENAAQFFTESFDQAGAARAVSLASIASGEMGQLRKAYDQVCGMLAQAENLPARLPIGNLHGAAALSSLALGDLQPCWQHAQSALQAVEEDRSDFLRECMLGLLGELFFFLGDDEKAGQMYALGSETSVENFHALYNQAQFGAVQVSQGQLESGLQRIEQASACFQREEMGLFHLKVQLIKAHTWLACERPGEAETLLEQVKMEAEQRELHVLRLQSELLRARAALQQKHLGEAIQRAAAAASQAQQMGHLPLEIEIRALWLEAARQGDITIPTMLGQRLRECVSSMGAAIQSPELIKLFFERQKAWTKTDDLL